jgi:hypothetical protein
MDRMPHYIDPVSSSHFKNEVHSDIMAFHMSGAQYTTDNETHEVKHLGPDNDLIRATVGVIWNDHFVTMT